MSDIRVTLVGAAIAVSLANPPIAVSVIGQQGPAGPALPDLGEGQLLFTQAAQVSGSPSLVFDPNTNQLAVTGNVSASNYVHHASGAGALTASGVQAGSGAAIGFTDIANATGTMDTMLRRGGAGILEQRNGAASQTFRISGGYTDSSNNSWLELIGNSGSFSRINAAKNGTGTNIGLILSAASHILAINGTSKLQVDGNGHLTPYPNTGNSNAFNLGTQGYPFRTGYFGTSVATPLVQPSTELTNLNLAANGAASVLLWSAGQSRWALDGSNNSFRPMSPNAYDFATAAVPARSGYFGTSVVTPLLDGGIGNLTVQAQNGNGKLTISSGVGTELSWSTFKISIDSTGANFTTPIHGSLNALEVRNGANAQAFRLYNTYTDASNYERGFARWNSNIFEVGNEGAGTGVLRTTRIRGSQVAISINGIDKWVVDASGNLLAYNNDNDHDLGAPTQRVRTGHFGTSVVTPAITFPAVQVPSAGPNTLDDYREGTFTPSVAFGGLNTGVTYSYVNGTYTKVGNRVDFRISAACTSKGTAVGFLAVTGLPFAAQNAATGGHATASVYVNGLSGLTGHVQALIQGGESMVRLYQAGTGSASAILDTNCTNAMQVIISGTYFV